MRRPSAAWTLILLTVAVVGACGRDERRPPPVILTPQAGVRTLEIAPAPTASAPPANLTVAVATPAAPDAGEPARPVAAPAVIEPGVTTVNTRPVRLYAAPDTSLPALASYTAGTAFLIMEPDGEFAEYPVQVFDEPWFRVRAEDGLVGWIPGGSLTVE